MTSQPTWLMGQAVMALAGLAHAIMHDGPCWCGVAIGNPMQREHSDACKAAKAVIARVEAEAATR